MSPTIVLPGLTGPTGILLDLPVTSRKHALQILAEKAADSNGLPMQDILAALIERERLGGTAIGGGIAIPHARVSRLDRIFGLLARPRKPIDFDAFDGRPVDLIYLLLVPRIPGADHLRALARAARSLRDRTLCQALRRAHSPDEAWRLLSRPGTPAAG